MKNNFIKDLFFLIAKIKYNYFSSKDFLLKNKESLAYEALNLENDKLIDFCIKNGIDFNKEYNHYNSPLHYKIINGILNKEGESFNKLGVFLFKIQGKNINIDLNFKIFSVLNDVKNYIKKTEGFSFFTESIFYNTDIFLNKKNDEEFNDFLFQMISFGNDNVKEIIKNNIQEESLAHVLFHSICDVKYTQLLEKVKDDEFIFNFALTCPKLRHDTYTKHFKIREKNWAFSINSCKNEKYININRFEKLEKISKILENKEVLSSIKNSKNIKGIKI